MVLIHPEVSPVIVERHYQRRTFNSEDSGLYCESMAGSVNTICGIYAAVSLSLSYVCFRDKERGKSALWLISGLICGGLWFIPHLFSY